jgi:carboxylate-amine ligase
MTAESTLPKAVSAAQLRELFDHTRAPTFGVEEELMVLDPDTLDLAPRARELYSGADQGRVKLELPASQLELITTPCAGARELAAEIVAGRSALAETVGGNALLASAGAHPFARAEGPLNSGAHYERTAREYGAVARRQLVCGLHVHIGLGGPARVLAVYNALRGHLPELAALGANAPLRAGSPAGMASVRPLIAGLLPRQGIPPAYLSWEQLADDLAWGARAGRLQGLAGWWWELRIHAVLGTIEIRVPDAQRTCADATALATTAAALTLHLAALHDAGELPPAAPGWRIAENRWSGARHGVHGEMADLRSGALAPTRDRLHALLEALLPTAARIGGTGPIEHAHLLAERNGADRQLEVAGHGWAREVARWLSDSFLEGLLATSTGEGAQAGPSV